MNSTAAYSKDYGLQTAFLSRNLAFGFDGRCSVSVSQGELVHPLLSSLFFCLLEPEWRLTPNPTLGRMRSSKPQSCCICSMALEGCYARCPGCCSPGAGATLRSPTQGIGAGCARLGCARWLHTPTWEGLVGTRQRRQLSAEETAQFPPGLSPWEL